MGATNADDRRWAIIQQYGPLAALNLGIAGLMNEAGLGHGAANGALAYAQGVVRALREMGIDPTTVPSTAPTEARSTVEMTEDGAEVRLIGSDPPSVREMMERFGLDPCDWLPPATIEPRAWTTTMRRDEEIVQVANWHLKVPLVRHPAALVPDLSSRPVMPRAKPKAPDEVETWVVWPDMQIGYLWRDHHTYLDPFHDRWAMDCALQLTERLQPTGVLLLGDDLDLAPLGTYERDPRVDATTHQAVTELRWWCEQIRAAVPSARFVKLTGNHEQRLVRDMHRSAGAAEWAGLFPDPLRWLYEERMRLPDLDVETVQPYGERFRFLGGQGVATHGEHTGPTAGKRTREHIEARVVVHGHTHHRYALPDLMDTARGKRERVTFSPGCLCRVDGIVPGRTAHSNWQQGVGVIRWHPRDERLSVSLHSIDRGMMLDAPGGPIVARDHGARLADEVHAACVRRSAA